MLRGNSAPAERGSRLLLAWSHDGQPFHSLPAISSENQLDSITVEAKKKEREELRLQIDQFVKATVAQHAGESLARWNTPVCPLVAGLPRDQGEFVLQRLSQSVRNAGAPLAPENCKANFFILVSSQADEILEALRKKRPGLFDTHNGLGPLQHFLRTERPVRVWQNWQNEGDDAGGLIIAEAFIGVSGGASMGGPSAPARLPPRWPIGRPPGCLTRVLPAAPCDPFHTAIIIVDLARIKSGNLEQLSDYFAMVGLAEINLDQTIVFRALCAPIVQRPSRDSARGNESMGSSAAEIPLCVASGERHAGFRNENAHG